MDDFNISESEIPPKQIFEKMKSNIFNDFSILRLTNINKNYIYSRKILFNILHKITIALGFKSQTFFLCAHYLDIIFSSKKPINLNVNIVGLSCLCLSAKHCENDPIVPHLHYFIKAYNIIMGYKNIISMKDLKFGEVLVLKFLNYKLNYFTVYDFNSFLFAHGILKTEQLKELGRDKSHRLYRNKRNEFVINHTNSLLIKNILEKIYKKSRYYLDIFINKTKLCFKYNSLLMSIYIMRRSVIEILENELSINILDKKYFYEKNNEFFREIMLDFYNVEYETNEQFQKLEYDEEIQDIFGKKEKKINDNDMPAPACAPKLEKKEIEKKEFNISNIENNKINNSNNEYRATFTSSVSNGFYRKSKIRIGIEELNKKLDEIKERNTITARKEKNNNSINKYKEKEKENTIDNININLNINELHHSYKKREIIKNSLTSANKSAYNIYSTNKEKEKENTKFSGKIFEKKNSNIPISNRFIPRLETYENLNYRNTISNLKYSENSFHGSKYSLNKKPEGKTEKNSPIQFDEIGINNNYSNYSRMNKFIKFRGLNYGKEKKDYSFSITENYNNEANKKSCDKKPYFKKLIRQNTIENYASLNFNAPNILSYIDKNKFDTINAESSSRGKDLEIKKFRTRINLKKPTNERNTLDTSINTGNENTFQNQNTLNDINPIISTSTRYRRRLFNTINNNRNNNDLSGDIKTENTVIIKDTSKHEIESYNQKSSNDNNGLTSLNFYRNNKDKISVNTAKNLENKNNENNKSFIVQKNKISYLLGKQNAELNNTLKEINKAYAKNKNEEKEKNINPQNNNNDKIINDSIKVNFTKSIRQRYLNINKNNKSFINLNKNNESMLDQNNLNNNKIEEKKEENSSINVDLKSNKNPIFIRYRYSSKNKNAAKINDISNKQKNSEQDEEKNNDNQKSIKTIANDSFSKIANNTKTLFKRRQNQKEENKDKDKDNDKIMYNSTNLNSFKSHTNFYKYRRIEKNLEEKRNKEEIIKNQQDTKIGNNSNSKNNLYKNRINKKEIISQNQKNNSNIIINNNININIENKNKNKNNNINNAINENVKYKNIYKKNNFNTSGIGNTNSFLNLKKDSNVPNKTNINRNDINNNSNNNRNSVNGILKKFQFYRRKIEKGSITGNYNSSIFSRK